MLKQHDHLEGQCWTVNGSTRGLFDPGSRTVDYRDSHASTGLFQVREVTDIQTIGLLTVPAVGSALRLLLQGADRSGAE
jgi:hypothetical protein